MPDFHKSADARLFAVDASAPLLKASGVYTWVIGADTVYGDSLVASSFGFTDAQGKSGLPLIDYIERIHIEDRGRVAKAIHDTMLTGNPFCEQYRVCRPDGSVVDVIAFGSCFRDASGEPSHYSGMVFPTSTLEMHCDTLTGHLLAAHEAACREGKPALAGKIIETLIEAGWRGSDPAFASPGTLLH